MNMEKRSAHCPLERVRQLIDAGCVRTTAAAAESARLLGFLSADMVAVVRALTPREFYKSMTTHRDHRVWQDVYHVSTSRGGLYVKLTVVDDLLIVSFKEL